MEVRSAGLFSFSATASMSSFGSLRRGDGIVVALGLLPKALMALLLLALMMSIVFGRSGCGDRSSVEADCEVIYMVFGPKKSRGCATPNTL